MQRQKLEDERLFSDFISSQVDQLRTWYNENKGQVTQKSKASRIEEIKKAFLSEIKPQMKTSDYDWFESFELNNASLLSLSTYQSDLADFESVFENMGRDFKKFRFR